MQITAKKILALMSIALICASAISVTKANPEPEIYLSPKDNFFDTTTTPVGYKFNITLWFEDAQGVFAWQVGLYYDPTLLNCTKAWLPTWDPNYIFYGNSTVTLAPAYGIGSVLVGDSLFSGSASGHKKLAILEFKIIKAPTKGELSCVLDINNSDTYWLNENLEEGPVTKTNGYYKYSSPWVPPPPATIYVDPAKISDPLLTPCHNFTLAIMIANATDIYSFQFKLAYNKTVLHALNAQLGNFFPQYVIPTVTIDNTLGLVQFSAALTPPEPPRSGSGALATIEFHVESQGDSSLSLNEVEILDETGQPLPYDTRDGYFTNALITKLYVDPSEIIDPTLVPPKTFTVNIMLDDVENLYSYEFNMSFNKDVITCLYIIVNDVLNETHYDLETQISNLKGFIWVKVTYYSPAVPITTYTPITLTTISFRVKSIGSSPLDLHDTNLTDAYGAPIIHEVSDGFVMTLIRDVAVTQVTPLRDWAYAGWPVNIEVEAENLGNISETFYVTAYCNDTVIGDMLIVSLPPSTTTILTFTWDTTGLSFGNYQISAQASTVPYETNTTNNVYADGYVSIFTVKHDVAITAVTPESEWAYNGWLLNITVTAKNTGEVDENFNVTAFYDDTPIATVNISSLAPDTAINLTFTWNTTAAMPCHNYTISAEASPVPYEYNATNNIFTDGSVKIRIVGDLDGNGKVDVKDVAAAALAYGSYPGHPRWNPAADINRDNKIDVKDIAAISRNFGVTC
jgi:hypothetical protein